MYIFILFVGSQIELSPWIGSNIIENDLTRILIPFAVYAEKSTQQQNKISDF